MPRESKNVRKGSPRKPGAPQKINREKVVKMAAQGVSTADLAKMEGVSQRAVQKVLSQYGVEVQTLDAYKNNRADIFASLQGRALHVASMVLESVGSDEVNALAPHQKTGLLATCGQFAGILNDKERLERGQSTSNVQSLIVKVAKDVESMDKV